jgi:uncharacterized membrane protein (DUF106 family)
MGQIGLFIGLKIVTLFAAIAQTVGFIGLFAFQALDPYKWQLLIGGTVVALISEFLSAYVMRRQPKRHEINDAR